MVALVTGSEALVFQTAKLRPSGRRIDAARACPMALVLALGTGLFPASPAAAQDTQQNLGKTLLNILQDTVDDAIRNAPHNAWAKVDLAIQQCLVDNYRIVPGDLVDQGIYPNDARVRPYIEACKQSLSPPSPSDDASVRPSTPSDLGSYTQTSPGVYERSSPGLVQVASTYILRLRESEAMTGSIVQLLAGIRQKAQGVCAGKHSVARFRVYDGSDANASAYDIHEPWIDAQVECSVNKPDPSDAAAALLLDSVINAPRDDSTKAMLDGAYFESRTETVYAPYDLAFKIAEQTLAAQGDTVAFSDSDKGMIVTANPSITDGLHREQFFMALTPDTDATTLVTIKLLRSWRDMTHPQQQVFIVEDRDSVVRRTTEFVDAMRERILKTRQ